MRSPHLSKWREPPVKMKALYQKIPVFNEFFFIVMKKQRGKLDFRYITKLDGNKVKWELSHI